MLMNPAVRHNRRSCLSWRKIISLVCMFSVRSLEIETVLILSNFADKTQMSGYKGLAKINEPP